MAITLYDATVPNFLQVLAGVRGVLDKGLAHAKATGVDPESLVETRLCGDMHPLRFQVVSVVHHSKGALEGVERGTFSPPQVAGEDYAALQAMVAEAEAAVGRYTPEQVNKLEGRDLNFVLGERSLPFVVEDFLGDKVIDLHATDDFPGESAAVGRDDRIVVPAGLARWEVFRRGAFVGLNWSIGALDCVRSGLLHLSIQFVKDGGASGEGRRASDEISATNILEWFHDV